MFTKSVFFNFELGGLLHCGMPVGGHILDRVS